MAWVRSGRQDLVSGSRGGAARGRGPAPDGGMTMDVMSLTPMDARPPHRVLRESEPNAVLAARIDLTPSMAIFRVRPHGPVPPFEPGQYLALGISVDDRLIQRPYSTSSPAGTTDELEFLIRLVPGGTFTPFLWALPTGSPVHLGPPKGLFRADTGDTRTHLFIATGTGLAPFVSMIRSSRDPGVVHRAPSSCTASRGSRSSRIGTCWLAGSATDRTLRTDPCCHGHRHPLMDIGAGIVVAWTRRWDRSATSWTSTRPTRSHTRAAIQP